LVMLLIATNQYQDLGYTQFVLCCIMHNGYCILSFGHIG
jgi:hypothetical protein